MIALLGQGAWHGFAEEALWAKSIGPDRFEIQNTPFFANGIAYLDIVSAHVDAGRLVIDEVIEPSRRSTYRLLPEKTAAPTVLRSQLAKLSDLGCSYESFVGPGWTLYAIDVPPESVDLAFEALQSGHEMGYWDFDEGHFGGRQTSTEELRLWERIKGPK